MAGGSGRRPARVADRSERVVGVLPDLAGLDRVFDYLVEAADDAGVRVGTEVRVDLGGRRVAGWVVDERGVPAGTVATVRDPAGGTDGAAATATATAVPATTATAVPATAGGPDGTAGGSGAERQLRPIAHVRGWGPEPALVELAGWAAWRWAGRRRSFLQAASPPRAVSALPAPDLRAPAPPAGPADLLEAVEAAASSSPGVLRLPPVADPTVVVAAVAQRGPTLVVVPSSARAAVLASRLRRAGAGVALVPGDWPGARGGAGVVVGARAAAWAPCPGLAAVVVLDAHDEGLVEQRAPTWWASVVAAERARRAGVPCVWVTPVPTLDLLALAGNAPARLAAPRERAGWAPIEVVDRTLDDPRLGLWSERLARTVREAGRVVCVLNRTGRARLLACASCRALARCEHCGAAVLQPASPEAAVLLACPRCGRSRPPVCLACGSTRLRRLVPGVTRAREELSALCGRPVGEVTAAGESEADAPVLIGTEAVLHRAELTGAVDVVAFVDFDQELLAPRARSGEEALALLARAARLVRGHGRHGRVLVQTRVPDHEVLDAAIAADPGRLSRIEDPRRRALRLPPHSALAVLSGAGAEVLAGAAASPEIEVLRPDPQRSILRAPTAEVLCDALAGLRRPPGRLRIEVDPVRF